MSAIYLQNTMITRSHRLAHPPSFHIVHPPLLLYIIFFSLLTSSFFPLPMPGVILHLCQNLVFVWYLSSQWPLRILHSPLAPLSSEMYIRSHLAISIWNEVELEITNSILTPPSFVVTVGNTFKHSRQCKVNLATSSLPPCSVLSAFNLSPHTRVNLVTAVTNISRILYFWEVL